MTPEQKMSLATATELVAAAFGVSLDRVSITVGAAPEESVVEPPKAETPKAAPVKAAVKKAPAKKAK